MKIETILKLIIALLAIMIVSLALILFLMNYDEKNTDEGETTPESSTTEDLPPVTTPPVTTTPEITTTPELTTPPITSTPDTSVPDTSVPDTSETEPVPPETTAPVEDPVPEDFELNKEFRSNSGAKLNIKAVLQAKSNGNGGVKVTVKVYLEHYSIGLGKRSGCTFKLGDAEKIFTADAISYSGSAKASTLLYTFECDYEYGEDVDLLVTYLCRCTYSGKYIDKLEISDTVTLK